MNGLMGIHGSRTGFARPTMVAAAEASPATPAGIPVTPGPHDVLLGRGGGTNGYGGNVMFREVVSGYKMKYLKSSKVEKPNVAREVVAFWKMMTPPGRFLVRQSDIDKKINNKKGAVVDINKENKLSDIKRGLVRLLNDVWVEVDDKKAQNKASQCLRERTADVLPFIQHLKGRQDFRNSIHRQRTDDAVAPLATGSTDYTANPVTPEQTHKAGMSMPVEAETANSSSDSSSRSRPPKAGKAVKATKASKTHAKTRPKASAINTKLAKARAVAAATPATSRNHAGGFYNTNHDINRAAMSRRNSMPEREPISAAYANRRGSLPTMQGGTADNSGAFAAGMAPHHHHPRHPHQQPRHGGGGALRGHNFDPPVAAAGMGGAGAMPFPSPNATAMMHQMHAGGGIHLPRHRHHDHPNNHLAAMESAAYMDSLYTKAGAVAGADPALQFRQQQMKIQHLQMEQQQMQKHLEQQLQMEMEMQRQSIHMQAVAGGGAPPLSFPRTTAQPQAAAYMDPVTMEQQQHHHQQYIHEQQIRQQQQQQQQQLLLLQEEALSEQAYQHARGVEAPGYVKTSLRNDDDTDPLPFHSPERRPSAGSSHTSNRQRSDPPTDPFGDDEPLSQHYKEEPEALERAAPPSPVPEEVPMGAVVASPPRRDGSPEDPHGEVTLAEYRRTLDEYVTTNNISIADKIVYSDEDNEIEREEADLSSVRSPGSFGGRWPEHRPADSRNESPRPDPPARDAPEAGRVPPHVRRLHRNHSGHSMMSNRTSRSSIASVSGMSLLSSGGVSRVHDDDASMHEATAADAKIAEVAKNFSSNESVVSEISIISNNMDGLYV